MVNSVEGNVLIRFYLEVAEHKTSVFYKDNDLEFYLENNGLLSELKLEQGNAKLHLIYEGMKLKVRKQEYNFDNLRNKEQYEVDISNDKEWDRMQNNKFKPIIDAFIESIYNTYEDIKKIRGKEFLNSFIYKINIYDDLDYIEWVNEGDVEDYSKEVLKLKNKSMKYIKQ